MEVTNKLRNRKQNNAVKSVTNKLWFKDTSAACITFSMLIKNEHLKRLQQFAMKAMVAIFFSVGKMMDVKFHRNYFNF